MAKWIYLGEKYKSIPIDWNEFNYYNGTLYCEKYKDLIERCYANSTEHFEVLVYNPKWNKCFTLLSLGWHGNGNELKAQIEDIYTKKIHWVSAKNLELVTKRK